MDGQAQTSTAATTDVEAYFLTGKHLHVAKGQYALRGEDDPKGMYYLKAGFIRSFGINQRGEDYTFTIIRPGEMFPWNWLLHETKRQIFFQALTPCELYLVGRDQLLEQAELDGHLAYGLLLKSVETASLFLDRLDNLEYKYAGERLAYRLLFLARRFGEKRTDGSYLLKVQLSQQLLASSINASRESVNREFERLQRKGYVCFEGPYIAIADIDALKRMFPTPLSPNWWGLSE